LLDSRSREGIFEAPLSRSAARLRRPTSERSLLFQSSVKRTAAVALALSLVAGCASEAPDEESSAAAASSSRPFEPRAEANGRFNAANAAWLVRAAQVVYFSPHAQENVLRELRDLKVTRYRFFDADRDTQAAYVATERAAILVFRGTNGARDYLTNVQFWKGDDGVHRGFRKAFDGVWTGAGMVSEPKMGIRDYLKAEHDPKVPLYVTGHSLGAALATLAIEASEKEKIQIFAGYTFGSPRLGNEAFADALAQVIGRTGTKMFRVVNYGDVVTALPPSIGLDYKHVSRKGEDESEGNRDFVFLSEKDGQFFEKTSSKQHALADRIAAYANALTSGDVYPHTLESYVCKVDRLLDPAAKCDPNELRFPSVWCEEMVAAVGQIHSRSPTSGGCSSRDEVDGESFARAVLRCDRVVSMRDAKAFEAKCLPSLRYLSCEKYKSGQLDPSCQDQFRYAR